MQRPQPCVILSQRRCGAGALYRLLGPYLPYERTGTDVFRWSDPLGNVSERFHQQSHDQARQLLDNALGRGVFFTHSYETESWDFNRMLLSGLATHGYCVLHVNREDEAERLFSTFVATNFNAWNFDDIDALRARAQNGEALREQDKQQIGEWVKQECEYRGWFSNELAAQSELPHLSFSYESIFRRGTKALAQIDNIFGFMGLGPRASLLDDTSLLRFLRQGEHFTGALLAHSEAMREINTRIVEALAEFNKNKAG